VSALLAAVQLEAKREDKLRGKLAARRQSAAAYPSLVYVFKGRDAYTTPPIIRTHLRDATQSWWLHGQPVSLRRSDGSYLKNLQAFPNHNETADAFYALLDECLMRGCERPSGYPSPFHTSYKTKPVQWTINAMFARQFAGGWQEALQVGQFKGEHYRYDIRSAYLSALGEWLPDPESYSYSTDIRDNGLYVIEHRPQAHLPYPFNVWTTVNATAREIETYGLEVRRVIRGIKWGNVTGTDDIRNALLSLSFWKQAARAYWGRWAMVDQVECNTVSNQWKLPSRFANLPWAHLIVSRVRERLWHEAMKGDVVHVFVDSIICKGHRRIAPEVGGWKLEHIYTDGVRIEGPGHYGPLYGAAEKWAGLRKDDPRRTFVSNAFGRIPSNA
jgi:hypothetical protein